MYKLYQLTHEPTRYTGSVIDLSANKFIGDFRTSDEVGKKINMILESVEDYKDAYSAPDPNSPEILWYIVNYHNDKFLN